MCGEQNPWSLGLSFTAVEGDAVCARFQAHPELQGYDGILHGGIISALLDATMTHCLFLRGIKAVTGELRVRFLKPISSRALIDMKAWVLHVRPPLYHVAAEIIHENRVMAKAEAKFMHYAGRQ
jgi:uncharacterized protein (TIGR00369 family)